MSASDAKYDKGNWTLPRGPELKDEKPLDTVKRIAKEKLEIPATEIELLPAAPISDRLYLATVTQQWKDKATWKILKSEDTINAKWFTLQEAVQQVNTVAVGTVLQEILKQGDKFLEIVRQKKAEKIPISSVDFNDRAAMIGYGLITLDAPASAKGINDIRVLLVESRWTRWGFVELFHRMQRKKMEQTWQGPSVGDCLKKMSMEELYLFFCKFEQLWNHKLIPAHWRKTSPEMSIFHAQQNHPSLSSQCKEFWELKKEQVALKAELERLKKQHQFTPLYDDDKQTMGLSGEGEHVSIVVVGASGDLAKKKTFPSLFSLFGLGLLPTNCTIFGYARTQLSDEDFKKHALQNCKGFDDKKQAFADKLKYVAGAYDNFKAYLPLDVAMTQVEENYKSGHRLFYFAIPPSIFVAVSKAAKLSCMAKKGWTRVIVEKPFGKDLPSYQLLAKELKTVFTENQLYRIDHYLGKEMVQNILNLRFANRVMEPEWNRQYINSVIITFKEDIGTEGRGGYFDEFGIIRDVMQNHLLQIFSLIAMEVPVSTSAEDVRNEKVKLLKCVSPISIDEMVLGQYITDGKNPGYLEDPTVPKGSTCPTFAAAILHINNSRWEGVPFILKCGKALNERKAEIRIQYKKPPHNLYPKADPNELVIRVQPNEAVYFKFNSKVPGLSEELHTTELDLTYKTRFDARLPDAYERLIYDVLRGDHNLFVRDDELDAAWKIFTPVLHKIEKEKIKPETYVFGTRGPVSADSLLEKNKVERTMSYSWPQNKK